ncbi:MAG: hypothetical protein NT062_07410 [Proteobacteria bacterium]|nr:hypothetical protein [Pseudomonadota bacterium]
MPAGRQAAAIWVGCLFIAAVAFGGDGMHPHDLTDMALADPTGIGLVVVAIWLLVYLPVARAIVRAEAARYLQALPHGHVGPVIVRGGALVGLQLPWLVLWTLGAGARGVVVIAATTVVLVGLAAVRAPAARAGWPGWRGPLGALAAIHRRALLRRAGDALVRGAGLAVLAGGVGALFVRNNHLTGTSGAILGAGVATLMLVPAHLGTLAIFVDTQRATTWLARALGIAAPVRLAALAGGLALVHAITAALAVGVAAIILSDASTIAPWLGLQLGIAACTAVFETRVVVRGVAATSSAPLVGGALASAALAVGALGVFGPVGLVGAAAIALVAAVRA